MLGATAPGAGQPCYANADVLVIHKVAAANASERFIPTPILQGCPPFNASFGPV